MTMSVTENIETPQSLHELVEQHERHKMLGSNFVIATTATLHSLVYNYVFKLISFDIPRTIQVVNGTNDVEVFVKLNESLTGFLFSPDYFTSGVAQFGELRRDNNMTSVHLSESFAIIDPLPRIEEYKSYFEFSGDKIGDTAGFREHIYFQIILACN